MTHHRVFQTQARRAGRGLGLNLKPEFRVTASGKSDSESPGGPACPSCPGGMIISDHADRPRVTVTVKVTVRTHNHYHYHVTTHFYNQHQIPVPDHDKAVVKRAVEARGSLRRRNVT